MATTAKGIPYPVSSDNNDAPSWLSQLATWLDTNIGAFTTAQINAFTTAQKWDGRIVFDTTTRTLKRWDSTLAAGAGAWTTDVLGPGMVSTAALADGAVTTAKILDSTIATGDLANDAVTNAKFAPDRWRGTASPTLADSTATQTAWTESIDTAGFYTPAGFNFTIPAGKGGVYVMTMNMTLGAAANIHVTYAAGSPLVYYPLPYVSSFPYSSNQTGHVRTLTMYMAAGNAWTFYLYQNSGAPLTTSIQFDLVRLTNS